MFLSHEIVRKFICKLSNKYKSPICLLKVMLKLLTYELSHPLSIICLM